MDKKTVHLPGIVPGGCLLSEMSVWTGYFRRNERKGERYYEESSKNTKRNRISDGIFFNPVSGSE